MLQSFRNKAVLLLVIFAIFWSYPYIWGRVTYDINLNILYGIVLVGLLFCTINLQSTHSLPTCLSYICIFQFFGFTILGIVHGDCFYLMRYSVFIIIAYFMLWVISNTLSVVNYVQITNYILCAQVIVAAVSFILVYFDLIQPIVYINAGGDRTAAFYGLSSSVTHYGNVTRQTGFFDEPGALAFWGVYSLLFNKLFINNKWVERILTVCLLFTFSMAYYIQLVLYLFFFYARKAKQLLILSSALVIFGSYIYYFEGNDSELYLVTFQRFEKGDSGQLETNRDAATETGLKYFIEKPLFGNGKTYLENHNISVVDAPFETFAQDGVWGTFFIYLPLLFILFRFRNIKLCLGVFILLVGYIQRPFHVQLLHYIYIYMFFIMAYYSHKKI